jgi:hypothetical protein
MNETLVPKPAVMPVDSEHWGKQLNLCNFINAYYQYEDIHYCGDIKKILIIGPGQGLDTQIFKWRGFDVITFDIDETFHPNITGSAHDLRMFADKSFDVIIASHVLEHLPVPYLDQCLAEFSRVSSFSIIYLPVAGRHFQFQTKLDLKGLNLSIIFDLFNFLHKPDGVTARYCQGMHYWEMGMRGFTAKALAKRFSVYFDVVRHYRNKDWNPSYNWVLKSKI